tara:strand:- start:408 stop:671 length:264 start_codon:yes stop_codon:yes gene_type:complete
MILIYIIKPKFIFDYKNNRFKKFGDKKNETYLNIYVISILIALLVFLFFNLITKKEKKETNSYDFIQQQLLNQQLINQQLITKLSVM